MKCLLIMTFIFINGIENAEHKSRQSGTILREDDLDSKTKAWLLMVESGKADDEHVRKITPKSIFIAPLLTSRSTKCKEGYRHDHLGQCVKVIKLDHKAQLELLLKRLSAMYAEKKSEEEGLTHISSGPLHFSLPISGADTTTRDITEDETAENTTAAVDTSTYTAGNDTDELEYSGAGNDTALDEGSGFEGSGSGSGDCCNGTESATLISDELEYTEDTTTELTTTDVPYTTENYEDATFAVDTPKDYLTVETDTETPTTETRNDRIVFPDSVDVLPGRERPGRPNEDANYPVWPSVGNVRNNQFDTRKLPTQQLWWLPPNWRIDEEQRKPAVFKFWSHLPLVHDPSFAGDVQRRPFAQSQSHGEHFQHSTRVPDSFSIVQQPLATSHRRGRIYDGRRVDTDFIQPRTYHVVR